MHTYILFVVTRREHNAVDLINKHFPDMFAFVLMKEIFIRRSGQLPRKAKQILFTGYVYVRSELSEREFVIKMSALIRRTSDIIRILKYGDSDEYAVRDEEIQALMSLLNDDYCIEVLVGHKVGDKIRIVEGVLKGRDSIIKKVNKHRMEATILLEMMGAMREVTVGLDVIKRI